MTRSAAQRPALTRRRDVTVDRFKVILTTAVIVTHVAITYGANGDWFYREQTREGVVQHVLDVPIVLGALFVMGAFFFVAGCFVPSSLIRKGSRQYAHDRLVRLGIPVLVFVLVVVPLIDWLVATVAGPRRSLAQVLRDQLSYADTGPLWFAAALLLFSLVVAGGRAMGLLAQPIQAGISVRRLTTAGAIIAATSFALRLRFPIGTYQVGSLHIWQWGQCAGLFALGVTCGRNGLSKPPAEVLRLCRYAMALGLVIVVLVLATAHPLTSFGGGWHWQSAVVCVVEGAVSVSGTILLLDLCRAMPASDAPPLRWAKSAFGAYVLQAPVIVALSLVLRPVSLPAVVKLVIVGVLGVGFCFLLAGALRRIPVVRAIL